ncbi:MAG: signal recognition particle-docking protein FtsY [Bacillota bacterium]
MSFFKKFRNNLSANKTGFIDRLGSLFSGGQVDEEFYEELEEILVSGDVGVETTMRLVKDLRDEVKESKLKERAEVKELLIKKLTALMTSSANDIKIDDKPHVILLIGVNGSGKTTSAAKLANLYKKAGKSVLLVAGDTFRAAAIEQIEIWAERAGVELIKQQPGSDPSALFFDAMNSARSRNIDIVIGDTAGRLHNKFNLMEELNKINRVVARFQERAPHQVLLVLDATTGQNAIAQAQSFNKSMPVTGLILTKLDGTARGGIVLSIHDTLNIPVCYVGLGEKIEDLAPFEPAEFARALLES